MTQTRLLRFVSLVALIGLTSCADMESAYDDMFGTSAPKQPEVMVKSPNAAPVATVTSDDISTQTTTTQTTTTSQTTATPPATQIVPTGPVSSSGTPVQLGSISDNGQLPTGGSASETTTTMTTIQPAAPALTTPPPAMEPVAPAATMSSAEMSAPAVAAAPVVTKTTTTETTRTTVAPAPVAPAAMAAPTPAADTQSVALLTIRFNQPHVYYESALTSAVQQAEQAHPGIIYEVLSTVPDLSVLPADQKTKLESRAKDNLRNIVVKMQQLGIPASRIRIAEQIMRIRSQEVQIFVR